MGKTSRRIRKPKNNITMALSDDEMISAMGLTQYHILVLLKATCQPRWLSGLRRSRIHSLVIARRSLCPEKLGSNPGQGSKGINFSGWHGLDMSITVTKRR